MRNSNAVFNDMIIRLEKEGVHLSHASPVAAPKLMRGILEEQVLMQQKDNFPKEWSPDGKKILGRHSHRKKSADDKGEGAVEGSIKTRCTGLWIRPSGSSTVFLRIASRKRRQKQLR